MLQLIVLPSTPPATSGTSVVGKNWKFSPYSLMRTMANILHQTPKKKKKKLESAACTMKPCDIFSQLLCIKAHPLQTENLHLICCPEP